MHWRLRQLIERLTGRSYSCPKGPARHLSARSMARVDVAAGGEADRPTADLYATWQIIPGGHKWWHYFEAYEPLLAPLRQRPIRFLEVGVFNGSSLAMWRRYLHEGSTIVGIDIDPVCAQHDAPAAGIHVRIGDQSDTAFLQKVIDEFGPFDVIIDDGSHIVSHMIRTFEHCFLEGLTDTGIYLAEDTHTNFWPEYRDRRYSFVDLCKDLVDLVHEHYVNERYTAGYGIDNPTRTKSAAMTRIGAQIAEIRFLDSIVVIRRQRDRRLPVAERTAPTRDPA